jgi:pyruvate/2-oxoglutarate dehydrogenase complex dihydrolipoamide dehydrogenase (E3) component
MRAPDTPGTLTPDLCVIGAGSAGLSVAAGAVQMGASVVLIEDDAMGGDCLNRGCVPSKALISAARKAQAHRASAPWGVAADEPEVDYAAAMEHVRRAIEAIAPHDSQERFEGLGCTVLRARAAFVSPEEVEAGGRRVRARRFVIATGSRPMVPPVEGIDAVPYLTNETIWSNREKPGHLIVLGGGPIGMEMAQAHRRLGSRVTVLEAGERVFSKDDPETAAVVVRRMRAEGVEIREGAKVAAVSGTAGALAARLGDGTSVEGTHLLVAAGRAPSVDLGLERAGVEYSKRGIAVDRGLRSTTNRRVYAIGDVAGGLQFTHVAGWHAGLVVRSALFRLPVRADTGHIPWCSYTDPELAQAGLTEAQARERHGDRVEVLHVDLAATDRAVAEGVEEGLLKAVIGRRGRILGASIAGPHAGELIAPWALALANGLKIGAFAATVLPYPTLSEASKKAASNHYAPRLFESPLVERAVRLLARLG